MRLRLLSLNKRLRYRSLIKRLLLVFAVFKLTAWTCLLLSKQYQEAAERGRNGEGATLIEVLTYRFRPHSMADDTTKYRTKEEEAGMELKDPLTRFAQVFGEKRLWSEEDTARVKEEAKATVNEHIKKAEAN